MSGAEGATAQGAGPVGTILPVYNTAHSAAIIDSVQLIGHTRYPSPRVIRLAVLASATCGGVWPARSELHGFVMVGCGGRYLGPLIGRAVGPITQKISPGFPAAAELSGPGPGTCWVTTEVVVHYHIGIRYWSATDPFQLAVCAKGSPQATVNAAMSAAEQIDAS